MQGSWPRSVLLVLSCLMAGGAAAEVSELKPMPVESEQPDSAVVAKQKAQVQAVMESMVFPKPLSILEEPSQVEGLFNKEVVSGSVAPLGRLADFQSVIDYLYGLSGNIQAPVVKVDITSLLADGKKVAVQTELTFCRRSKFNCSPATLNSVNSFVITMQGFFSFDSQQRIVFFELALLDLGTTFDRPALPEVRIQDIFDTCKTLTSSHLNPITYAFENEGTCSDRFAKVADFPPEIKGLDDDPFQNCVVYMSSISYGSWDRVGSNSFVCRQLQTLLTSLRPDVYCPNASPSGGSVCVDSKQSFFKGIVP